METDGLLLSSVYKCDCLFLWSREGDVLQYQEQKKQLINNEYNQ